MTQFKTKPMLDFISTEAIYILWNQKVILVWNSKWIKRLITKSLPCIIWLLPTKCRYNFPIDGSSGFTWQNKMDGGNPKASKATRNLPSRATEKHHFIAFSCDHHRKSPGMRSHLIWTAEKNKSFICLMVWRRIDCLYSAINISRIWD